MLLLNTRRALPSSFAANVETPTSNGIIKGLSAKSNIIPCFLVREKIYIYIYISIVRSRIVRRIQFIISCNYSIRGEKLKLINTFLLERLNFRKFVEKRGTRIIIRQMFIDLELMRDTS